MPEPTNDDPIFNDGDVPFGSEVITIATVPYVADDIDIDEPSNVIERTNHKNKPTGQVGTAGFIKGTATLQLADSDTPYPFRGQTFTLASGKTYWIEGVKKPKKKDAETKVPITFRLYINAEVEEEEP